jgi:(2R)-sulfolactate sulfo-lyase subunit alpha
MQHKILIHDAKDDVGVAVDNLHPGDEVGAVTLEGEFVTSLTVGEEVPLGHKIAMRDIPEGKEVIEYGRAIGKASSSVRCGSHVHIHNLKTQRWAA